MKGVKYAILFWFRCDCQFNVAIVVFGEKLALMNRLCGIKPIMCVGAIGHSFLPKVKLCAAKSWP